MPPLSSFLVLNSVLFAIRSTSFLSEVISEAMAPRSVLVRVSFEPWTASSRIRWRIEWVSFSPPSAVWIIEMPSWALRIAWLRPLVWPRSFSLIERPAASSPARLMRRPLDSRSMLFDSELPTEFRLRWALIALTLVLMRTRIPPVCLLLPCRDARSTCPPGSGGIVGATERRRPPSHDPSAEASEHAADPLRSGFVGACAYGASHPALLPGLSRGKPMPRLVRMIGTSLARSEASSGSVVCADLAPWPDNAKTAGRLVGAAVCVAASPSSPTAVVPLDCRRRERTPCGSWFAWARIEVPAC